MASVGWFGRTFGWSGSRQQWATLAGVVAWLAGAVALAVAGRGWSAGQAVMAGLGWLLAGGLVARSAVAQLFGPVFAYDAVRVSRSRTTFVVRGFYAFGLAFVLGVSYWSFLDTLYYQNARLGRIGTGEMAKFATDFFYLFSVIQFAAVQLLTPVYVAGAITVEKERKTLEFLLATDLRNAEIVFGKVAARVLTLLQYVFAGLPIVAMLQLFGGIDPEMLLSGFAATVISVVGLSAISIWLSTMMRKARDAIVLSYLLIVAFYFASFFAAAFSNFSPWAGWWNTRANLGVAEVGVHDVCWAFACGNPAWHVLLIAEGARGPIGAAGFAPTIADALRQYAVFWGLAVALFLGWAVARLRAVALHQTYGPPPGTRTRKKRVRTAAGEQVVTVNVLDRTYPDVGDNPVFWKEVFVDSAGATGCVWRVVGGLVLTCTFVPLPILFYLAFLERSELDDLLLGLLLWVMGISVTLLLAGGLAKVTGRPAVAAPRALFGLALAGVAVPMVLVMLINVLNNTPPRGPGSWYEFLEAVSMWVRIATGVVGTLMLFGAAIRGASAVSGERDRDTWISLMGVPLSADAMLHGKFWGCVLGQRRVFAVLLVIWGIGLATGATHPLAVLGTLAMTAVFLPLYSLVGIWCSLTARNTLIASVRAFFAALFVSGGFWILAGLFVFLPMGLLRVRDNLPQTAGQFFGGLTVPYVYGWSPVQGFERRDLEPFVFAENRTYDGALGYFAPILGTAIWAGVAVVLYLRCVVVFRRITNRTPVTLPDELRVREELRRKAADSPPGPNGSPGTPAASPAARLD